MVANDALELLFTGSALLGAMLLFLSILGGGARLRVHVPIRMPYLPFPFVRVVHVDDPSVTPLLLGFLAMFGLGGLFGRVAFRLGAVGQLGAATALGLAGLALAFLIFGSLRRSEAPQPTALQDLVGRPARVTVSIGPGTRGTVRLIYDGAVQILPAVAPTPIARGRDVEIVAVHGMGVAVREMPPP